MIDMAYAGYVYGSFSLVALGLLLGALGPYLRKRRLAKDAA